VRGKKIIVGVTAGIASYKTAELVRLLMKDEAQVQVAMTPNAIRFVAPATFEALSGSRVIWDMFGQEGPDMEHITWGQSADLIIIAPATANFIAKMAHGIADDFLSTMVLASSAGILLCPSMNSRMFMNDAVRDNLRILRNRGVTVLEPGEGELACRTAGPGRLPEPYEILEQAKILVTPQDFSGVKILVTAGATVEPIDPVRYLSNRSSGKMGYALARAARRRGASVILVSGPTALLPPAGVTFRAVKTAEDMKRAVLDHCPECHVIIKAAAVADYRPRKTAPRKIKKNADSFSLELERTPDILAQLGALKKTYSYFLVGFAAETESLLSNAKAKLTAKNLDLIVANDVSRSDAGFEADTNRVKILYRDGTVEDVPLMSKDRVADLVLDRIKSLTEKRP